MALNAALGSSKILIILGAGVAGSILVQNGNMSDFVNDTYKVFAKHLRNDTQSGNQSSVNASLLAQINKLKQELSNLGSERASITVVSGSSGSNGLLFSIGLPVLLIGASGYGLLRLRGFSLSDFMYVTKRGMSDAISNVKQHLEHVTIALSATKKQLNSKIDDLSGSLDQNMALQGELKNEVCNLHGDVTRYSLEIQSVQRIIQALGMKIDSLESKQDIANRGVIYLCNFVEGMQTPQRPQPIQGSSIPRLRLERSPSTFHSGLKDLQSITSALQFSEINMDVSNRDRGEKASQVLSQQNLASPSARQARQ